MKKAISLLLTLVLLLTLAVPAFAAEKQGTDVPNVYLQGQGSAIKNAAGERIYDGGNLPEGFLSNAVKECMPLFITAMKDDTEEAWNAYRTKLLDLMLPIYGKFALGTTGVPTDGSTVDVNFWDNPAQKYSDGSYKLRSYNFYQD